MANPVTMCSQSLRVEVDAQSGAFAVVDLSCGKRWGVDPWQQTAGILTLTLEGGRRADFSLSSAGRITVSPNGDDAVEIEFAALKAMEDPATVSATVRTRLSLQDGNALRVEVLAVDLPDSCGFVELEYPCRLGALRTDVDQGYLVVPYWQGCLVPSTCGAFPYRPRVAFWAWDDMPWRESASIDLTVHGWTGLSMPFFGAVDGASGWCAIFDTEDDAALRCVLNNNWQHKMDKKGVKSGWERVAVSSPLWLAQMGTFGYPRAMTYYFAPHSDYVAIAKRYRQEAQRRGLAVTLREKAERCPHVDTIIGAPLLGEMGAYPWYLEYPAYNFTWNDLRKRIDHYVNDLGMQRAMLCVWGGYEHYPPDSYPFHPRYGTVEELKAAVRYGLERNILICFYHGYPALLDHDPQCDFDRAIRTGPRGEIKSRWGRHCSNFYLQYARKNLPPSLRDSGQVVDYTDMLTASPIEECWDERHRHTRTEDRRNKEELLKYINSLGVFTGSENPRGWAVPYMAYAKNGGWGGGNPLLSSFKAPLWNLVYHDCLVAYHKQGTPDVSSLEVLAIGTHLQSDRPDILRLMSDFTRRVGREELLSHRFESELNGPFSTEFADGTEARVNPMSHEAR